MNEKKFCGVQDWITGVEKSVDGLQCDGIWVPKDDPNDPPIIYTIYKIIDEKKSQLKLGKLESPKDGFKDAENRPIELDNRYLYLKK